MLVALRDVDLERDRAVEARGRRLGAGAVDVGDGDARALGGEDGRDTAPDPVGAARDDRGASVEALHGFTASASAFVMRRRSSPLPHAGCGTAAEEDTGRADEVHAVGTVLVGQEDEERIGLRRVVAGAVPDADADDVEVALHGERRVRRRVDGRDDRAGDLRQVDVLDDPEREADVGLPPPEPVEAQREERRLLVVALRARVEEEVDDVLARVLHGHGQLRQHLPAGGRADGRRAGALAADDDALVRRADRRDRRVGDLEAHVGHGRLAHDLHAAARGRADDERRRRGRRVEAHEEVVGRLLEARGRRVDARRLGHVARDGAARVEHVEVRHRVRARDAADVLPVLPGGPRVAGVDLERHRRLLRLGPVDPVGAARQVVAHLEQRLLQQLHRLARAGGLHALAVGDVVLAREVAERELELGHAGEAGRGQSLGGALGDVGHLGCGEIGLES